MTLLTLLSSSYLLTLVFILHWANSLCFTQHVKSQDQILDVKQIFPLQAKPDKLAQYQGGRKKDLIVVGGMLSIELKLAAVMAAFLDNSSRLLLVCYSRNSYSSLCLTICELVGLRILFNRVI